MEVALQCSSVSPAARAEAGCLAFAPASGMALPPPPPPPTTPADAAANGILPAWTVDASTGYLAMMSTLLGSGGMSIGNATITLAGNDVAISGQVDVSTPLVMIGAGGEQITVTLDLDPYMASAVGGVIAVAQPAATGRNGAPVTDGVDGSVGGGAAEFASDLVSVGLLNADGRVLENAASIMEAPAELVLGLTQYLPAGGGNCSVSELAFGSRLDNTTCIAGCCSDDLGCVCRDGYAGELCEYELRCAIVPAGEASFASDGSVCLSTLMDNGQAMRCTCADVGIITVIRFRLTPANNLQLHPGWFTELWQGVGMSWAPPMMLLYLALYIVCAWHDARTLFISTDAPQLPWWARTAAFDVRAAFVETLLTRSTPLRVIFALPGHTIYTRVQLLHVLVLALVAQAFSIMLFLGRDQCSTLAALMVTVSTLVASLVATICRLLFRCGNLVGRRKHEYRMRKDSRRDAQQLRRLLNERMHHGKGSAFNVGEQEQPSGSGISKANDPPASPPLSPPPPASPPSPLPPSQAPLGEAQTGNASALAARDSATGSAQGPHAVPPALGGTHADKEGETAAARVMAPPEKQTCPCCQSRTLSERGAFEICPVCKWEDDGQDDENAHEVTGGPNATSLIEARRLYREKNGVDGAVLLGAAASGNASAPAPTPSAVVPLRDEDTWLAISGDELGVHVEGGRGDTYRQLIDATRQAGKARTTPIPILKAWTNRPHDADDKGESSAPVLQIDLDYDRLSVGADGYTLGFLILRDAARSLKVADGSSSSTCTFVAAVHIGRVGYNRYRVMYRSDAPVAAASVVPGFAEGLGDAPGLLIRPGGHRWRIAWAVNVALLLVSAVGAFHLLGSGNDTSTAHYLQASALSEDEWQSTVLISYLYSVAQSFLIVDGVKVGLIWLTSAQVLQAAFPHGSLRHRLIIKPLRRIHKVVDTML